MTKEFFKEFCKHIRSEILEGIPKGAMLSIYRGIEGRDGDYYEIHIDGWKYIHYRDGREEICYLEGLDE
jgi:hypothetical protein